MAAFDTLCGSTLPAQDHHGPGGTHECDYDKNPTSLYEAIEERAWHAGYNFFKSGKWEKGVFFAPVTDPLSPERQARTWVTRFEPDGKVRWSQLPLHAAIIFGAPYQFIAELVKIYPQGVRCTDDQHMLPLHLSIKFGAEDCVVACLLDSFPESIFTKDIRGRLPTEVDSIRPERSQIMELVIAVMAKTLTRRHGEAMDKNMEMIKEDLFLQNNLNMELERDKKEIEVKWKQAQAEINVLKSNLEALKATLKKKSAADVQQNMAQAEAAKRAGGASGRSVVPRPPSPVNSVASYHTSGRSAYSDYNPETAQMSPSMSLSPRSSGMQNAPRGYYPSEQREAPPPSQPPAVPRQQQHTQPSSSKSSRFTKHLDSVETKKNANSTTPAGSSVAPSVESKSSSVVIRIGGAKGSKVARRGFLNGFAKE